MKNDRKCKHCGVSVEIGFCIRDGEAYYCSPNCLETAYTETEYADLYEAGEAYWTEWED